MNQGDARRLLIAVLVGGLVSVRLGAAETAKAEPTQATPAIVAQLSLPPVATTRLVIAALPPVQAARAALAVAQARGQRLEAGSYEWNLRLGAQRRQESGGPQLAETELAMERSIRWGGKADADRQLGEAGVAAAQSAYADAWHEAVRSLVKAWYDWQRERGAAAVLTQQATLAQEQLQVAMRRVKAGEAPRIDQLMAQAEQDRALAAQQQSQLRAQVLLQELQSRFPGIAIETGVSPTSVSADELQWADDEQTWLRRIVDDNHEVELAEMELRTARLQSQRAQLDTRPDPLLGVRAARERGGQESIVGVYVTIPLPGAYREAEQRATLALADAAEQRVKQARQRVEAAAQRVVLQARHNASVWQRLAAVQQSMTRVAQLAVKAYGLGELTLAEALQARRAGLDAALTADAARWDALEAMSRLLVDAHQLWAAEEHGHAAP